MAARALAPVPVETEVDPVWATARHLARRGLYVFPVHSMFKRPDGTLSCTCLRHECANPGKHPDVPTGRNEATTEPARIDAWFKGKIGRDARNVGVATGAESGVWVLDLDKDKDGDEDRDGMTVFDNMVADRWPDDAPEAPQWPATWTVLTGGGGMQLYFRWPAPATGLTVRSRAKKAVAGAELVGIDTRGHGGYVIAPPSRHASGGVYRWAQEGHPVDTPLADAPAWLLTLVAEPADPDPGRAGGKGAPGRPRAPAGGHRLSAAQWRGIVGRRMSEGGRNQALAQFTGKLAAHGLDWPVIALCGTLFGRHWCEPALDDAEIAQTVRSIVNGHYRRNPDAAGAPARRGRRRKPDFRPLKG